MTIKAKAALKFSSKDKKKMALLEEAKTEGWSTVKGGLTRDVKAFLKRVKLLGDGKGFKIDSDGEESKGRKPEDNSSPESQENKVLTPTPPPAPNQTAWNVPRAAKQSILTEQDKKLISDRITSADLNTVFHKKVNAGTDPSEAARKIPFYHNPDKGIYSIISDAPGLDLLASVILTILGSPNYPIVTLERIPFQEYNHQESKLEVGNVQNVDKLCKELIIYLNLREDASQYEIKSSSKAMVSITKILIKNQGKHLKSVNLNNQESLEIQGALNVKSGTLVYKSVLMLIDVMNRCLHTTGQDNLIRSAIDKLISGKSDAPIKRTLKDAGRVEPVHLYSIVLSPTERTWINSKFTEKGKDSIFHTFNKLSRSFRRGDASAAAKLQGLKTEIVSTLGNPVMTIIYGRLKVLGIESSKHRAELYGSQRSKRRLNYVKFITHLWRHRVSLSIFAEDNLFSVLFKHLTQSTVLSPVTEKIYWSLSEKRLKYISDEVKSVPVFQGLKNELKTFILSRSRVARDRSLSPERSEENPKPRRSASDKRGGKRETVD